MLIFFYSFFMTLRVVIFQHELSSHFTVSQTVMINLAQRNKCVNVEYVVGGSSLKGREEIMKTLAFAGLLLSKK